MYKYINLKRNICLPNIVYEGGGSKHVSSKMHDILPSSSTVLTPATLSSIAKIFPKVILAFKTWNNGISK